MNSADTQKIASLLAENPDLKSGASEVAKSFLHFMSVVAAFVRLLKERLQASASVAQLAGWIGRRNVIDMFLGYVLVWAIKDSYAHDLVRARVKTARGLLTHLGDLLVQPEVDEPTQPLVAGAVLTRRKRPFEEDDYGGFPAAMMSKEALTLHSDIRATGTAHKPYQVRLFSSDPVSSFKYVGMGMRIGEENLLVPGHVFQMLKDAPFKMKGSNRKVAELTFDPEAVVKEGSDRDDYVLYKVGKAAFARTGTAKPALRPLTLTTRVYLSGCHEGTESGTISEGIAASTSFNFLYSANYSSLPGYSGAAVEQLHNNKFYVVGMHCCAVRENGDVSNWFLSTSILNDFGDGSITYESVSVSSSVDTDHSTEQAMERVRAVQYAREYQAEAKRRGDHRFDDGVLEEHWAQVNAEEALREFRRNRDEFAQNFSYVGKLGWVRSGGKQQGGKMRFMTESSASLKGLERSATPLTEMSGRSLSSTLLPTKTSLPTGTSLASWNHTKDTSLGPILSRSSGIADQSQGPAPSETLPILKSLEQSLRNGEISKTKVREFINGWKVSEETSSEPSGSSQTQGLEESKREKA